MRGRVFVTMLCVCPQARQRKKESTRLPACSLARLCSVKCFDFVLRLSFSFRVEHCTLWCPERKVDNRLRHHKTFPAPEIRKRKVARKSFDSARSVMICGDENACKQQHLKLSSSSKNQCLFCCSTCCLNIWRRSRKNAKGAKGKSEERKTASSSNGFG